MKVWPLLFGFTWGVGLSLAGRLFPEIGPATMHSALACYLLVGAVIVWYRTRLHWFALAGVIGALTSAFAAMHPAVDDGTTIDWLIQLAGVVALILLAFIQSRADSRAWTELRSSMTSGNVGFMDALLLRTIPNLRTPRSEGD